jgi:DNA-binding NarL/FixJ family response regulator
MTPPHRVLIVDDHEVFAEALAICLGDYQDLQVVGIATTAAQATAALAQVDCDVVVLDLVLGADDGLSVAREAIRLNPAIGIVVATGAEAGEKVVVPKTATAESLVEAVRGVAMGQTRLPSDLLATVLLSLSQGQRSSLEHVHGISELTSRELEVLGCLVEGMSRTEIGALLHVSPNTVRTHVQSILHKLKVHSALAAVAIARRAGITGMGVGVQAS